MAPKIEPTLHKRANLKDFDLRPNANGISNTSGGIGKKDASAKARTNRTRGPDGRSAHFKTQS